MALLPRKRGGVRNTRVFVRNKRGRSRDGRGMTVPRWPKPYSTSKNKMGKIFAKLVKKKNLLFSERFNLMYNAYTYVLGSTKEYIINGKVVLLRIFCFITKITNQEIERQAKN